MRKRRQINADPDRPTMRSRLDAASEPVRGAAFRVEERVLWRGSDGLRKLGEVVRWPFERAGWAVERMLIWPLGERAAGMAPSRQTTGLAAFGAFVAAMAALGIALSGSGDAGPAARKLSFSPAPASSGEATEVARPAPSEPTLHGVAPSFHVGSGVKLGGGEASGESKDEEVVASDGSVDTAPAGAEAAGEEGASASAADPVPAGPAAMKVARRFSEAFVFYEIGKRPQRAKTVFSETAAPALAEALAERPPRQPAAGKVPKAKVLNLVPGPRHGRAYTVSVSLLRVGVTSELRLELEKSRGAWAVTDVRG